MVSSSVNRDFFDVMKKFQVRMDTMRQGSPALCLNYWLPTKRILPKIRKLMTKWRKERDL